MLASIYYPFHSALKSNVERGALGRQSYRKDNNPPPFNLQKLSENQFQIDLLVPGYQESEIELSVEGKTLTIEGKPSVIDHQTAEAQRQAVAVETHLKPTFLRQEWAVLPFRRLFSLESHLQVEDAKLSQGILSIFLKREVPQAEKPKIIPIHTVKN